MKLTLHLSELRAMEAADLDERLKAARTELFNLRFQAATGQLENHRQIRMVKRQIAQVLTVLTGRSQGTEQLVAAPDAGIETRESGGTRRKRAAASSVPQAADAAVATEAPAETSPAPVDDAPAASEPAPEVNQSTEPASAEEEA